MITGSKELNYFSSISNSKLLIIFFIISVLNYRCDLSSIIMPFEKVWYQYYKICLIVIIIFSTSKLLVLLQFKLGVVDYGWLSQDTQIHINEVTSSNWPPNNN